MKTLVLITAMIACVGLSLVDFYLDGQQAAREEQQRLQAYCASPYHSETVCNGMGL